MPSQRSTPKDYRVIKDIEFRLGRGIEAVSAPSSQMEATIRSLEGVATELRGVDIAKCLAPVSKGAN